MTWDGCVSAAITDLNAALGSPADAAAHIRWAQSNLETALGFLEELENGAEDESEPIEGS